MDARKILILDDNPIVFRAIENLVNELEYASVTVASTNAARYLLNRTIFDILLCDEDLGFGPEGLDFIKQNIDHIPQKIILMSGSTETGVLPANVLFLSKPFSVLQLEDALLD